MIDIFWNLVSAGIGFGISYLYRTIREFFSDRTIGWFWNPNKAKKIYIHPGRFEVLGHIGEKEPAIAINDAQALVQLRLFLSKYFKDIVVTFDESKIDWQSPVLSLGGPIPNKLSEKIGNSNKLPFWFLGMPYGKNSERSIGNVSVSYKSEFDENQILSADIGLMARIKPDENTKSYLYVIAGNYGFGTLGVVSYLTSSRNLKNLNRQAKNYPYFEVIIKTTVKNDNVSAVESIRLQEI